MSNDVPVVLTLGLVEDCCRKLSLDWIRLEILRSSSDTDSMIVLLSAA